MNREDREALTEKVRRSENPYEALFGQVQVGRQGKRRRTGKSAGLPPVNVMADKADRHRLAQKVHQRTLQVMKQLDPDLYRDIYDAEMKLAIAKLMDEKESAPNTVLKIKYKRNLVPERGRKNG